MLFLCCLPFSLKFTFTPKIYTFGCKFFDLGKSKGCQNLHLLETQGSGQGLMCIRATRASRGLAASPHCRPCRGSGGGLSGQSQPLPRSYRYQCLPLYSAVGCCPGLLAKLLVEEPGHGTLLAKKDNGLEIALRVLKVPHP